METAVFIRRSVYPAVIRGNRRRAEPWNFYERIKSGPKIIIEFSFEMEKARLPRNAHVYGRITLRNVCGSAP